jgi:hypothetical protein
MLNNASALAAFSTRFALTFFEARRRIAEYNQTGMLD